MPTLFAGNKKGLVFPHNSDSYVTIAYADTHADNPPLERRVGMWGHTSSFTLESIITPYEVNGFGTYNGTLLTGHTNLDYSPAVLNGVHQAIIGTDYTQIPAAYSQSAQHGTLANKLSQKMTIFHNANCELYLENTSQGNIRTPSSYKIVFKITASDGSTTTTKTIESEPIITPEMFKVTSGTADDIYFDSKKVAIPVRDNLNAKIAIASVNTGAKTFTVASDIRNYIGLGLEILNDENVSCGTISNIAFGGGSTVVTLTTSSAPLSGKTNFYFREMPTPLYTLNSFHVAATLHFSGGMRIYFNGIEVAKGVHNTSNLVFFFEPNDSYIGQNASLANRYDRRKTQFIGELHEVCMSSVCKKQFTSIETLLPAYDSTLFYFKFGGLDD
jgi:hypothetical protein